MNTLTFSALQHAFSTQQSTCFESLFGASKPMILAQSTQFATQPLLLIAETFEKAERWKTDLSFFIPASQIQFFPHWDTLPYDTVSPHPDIVAQRFQALSAILQQHTSVIITTPNALSQCILPKDVFDQHAFTLHTQHTTPIEKVSTLLEQAGYQHREIVDAKGEFSLRHHIMDIYPIDAQHPLRLRWESKTLSQIHPFDAQSQCTTSEESLDSLNILPAQEILWSACNSNHARVQLSDYRTQIPKELYEHLKHCIQEEQSFAGMESLLGLFYENTNTLLDYFPEQPWIVWDEPSVLERRIQDVHQETLAEYELSREQGHLALHPEQLFVAPKTLLHSLSSLPQLHLYEKLAPEHALPFAHKTTCHMVSLPQSKSQQADEADTSITFEHLQQWKSDNIPVVLTANTQTQASQLQHVLREKQIATQLIDEASFKTNGWLPWLQQYQSQTNHPLPILLGNVSTAFREVNDTGQTQWALITEESLFGQKFHQRRSKSKSKPFLQSFDDLNEGDHVVHVDYGIGRYEGLQRLEAAGHVTECMILMYARDEKVYVPVEKFHLVQKYVNIDGSAPKLHKLGDKKWTKSKAKAHRAVEDIAQELIDIYAARHAKLGHVFPEDNADMDAFELAFPYTETDDQEAAIKDIKQDMESPHPMDRLVCGDVGFGKTEVAMRAAYKACLGNKQVAVLVPTTILAQQHYHSFVKRFKDTPVVIRPMSRFQTASEQKRTLQELAEGQVDIVIGTHRLLSKDVQFQDLGLLIVDEEQRFGVKHKEHIKQFRSQVDVLTLSATPVPRTLYMSMMQVRDLSVIATPPADRMAIRTRVLKSNDYIIQEAVSRELRRKGQVFVVHNRVEDIYEYGSYLRKLLPDARIAIGHGQMTESQLEKVMLEFIEGKYDVLLATTIIESGLDIPKANTLIVNRADQFGLSQLYQLRGRVGRSNLQAYAYLLTPPSKVLSDVAQERLRTLQEFNDLGSGFKIASRDLELRGAGNLLGSEQSGHIADIGLELYTQMVERAVQHHSNQSGGSSEDTLQMNLKFNLSISEKYIPSTNQRLSLYKKLAGVQNEEQLWELRQEVEDRFGALPEEMIDLFRQSEIGMLAKSYHIESMEWKAKRLQIEFSQVDHLNTEILVQWLQDPEKHMQFEPESTLILREVPHELNAILLRLQDLQELYVEKVA